MTNPLASPAANPFYTIGHGTRPIGEFVDLLRSAAVTLLADVRTVPRSRANPQYNRDTLPQSLEAFGIGYEHMAALGGLRSRVREVAPEVNAFWGKRQLSQLCRLCHERLLSRGIGASA
jgi:uncharacterized protein (DUF488 family)